MTKNIWAYLAVLLLVPLWADAQPDAGVTRLAPKPSSEHRVGVGTDSTADSQPQPEMCARLPAGNRIMNLDLKPNTPIADIVEWISSITCKWFKMSLPELSQRKVTIASPRLLTPEESYDVFLASLASVGLTLEQVGKYQRVVEAKKDHLDPPQVHFAESALDKLVLLAVIEGTDGRWALLGSSNGPARIIKPGDRISTRTALVREIRADRLLVELPRRSRGAGRPLEIVLKPEGNSSPAKAAP